MKKALFELLCAAMCGLCLFSCGDSHGTASGGYTVMVDVRQPGSDSVALYVLEPDYGQLRCLGKSRLLKGSARFSGQIDAPRIAILRLNKVRSPFLFILEPCLTEVKYSRAQVVIRGGVMNHEYFQICKSRASLLSLSDSIRARYMRQLADSSLDRHREWALLRRDSLIADSVQRMLLGALQRRDVVGRLVADRYYHTLDTLHLRQLTGK